MAKVKKAKEELYHLLIDFYLLSNKSVDDDDRLLVPTISGIHPRQFIKDVITRTRRTITFLE